MRGLHRRQSGPQTSRALVDTVIASNFAQDGDPQEGQTPSLTSTNNFINFCSSQDVTDGTNGGQRNCNPAPIGLIPSANNLPSVKISNPRNGNVIPSDTTFTVSLASNNFAGTFFTNPRQAYMTAPQQLDRNGNIMGHFHFVIEALSSLNQTSPTTPTTFAFMTEIFSNPPQAEVRDGLPAGTYRAFATLHTINHTPVMLPISQHGSVSDAVYFTVEDGANVTNNRRSIEQPQLGSNVPSLLLPSRCSDVQRNAKRQDNADTSRELASSSVAASFGSDGTGGTPISGQISSLTSTNNYINFCAGFDGTPITNGEQVRTGSCNPAPLGQIVERDLVPSSKILFPTFGTVLTADQPLAVSVIVNNFEGGFRTSSVTNYMAAPQQLTAERTVRGYIAIAIEEIPSFTSAEPTNPLSFVWFEGLTVQGRGGGWSTIIDTGLRAGIYRLSTHLRAENHQPILVSTNLGGATGDVVYFTVLGEGGAVGGSEANFPTSFDIGPSSSGGPRPTASANGTSPGDSVNKTESAQTNVGAIAGGAVAGVAALGLAVFLILSFLRKRNAAQLQQQANVQPHAFNPNARGTIAYSSGGGFRSSVAYSGGGGGGASMGYSREGLIANSMVAIAASPREVAGGFASSGEGSITPFVVGEGSSARPNIAQSLSGTLGSPPPFSSPKATSSPYSLVSPDTLRSQNSSAPNSTSARSASATGVNERGYGNEKRLPQAPADRSSVVSAAPSYRTNA